MGILIVTVIVSFVFGPLAAFWTFVVLMLMTSEKA
jgi:hypothetical protein